MLVDKEKAFWYTQIGCNCPRGYVLSNFRHKKRKKTKASSLKLVASVTSLHTICENSEVPFTTWCVKERSRVEWYTFAFLNTELLTWIHYVTHECSLPGRVSDSVHMTTLTCSKLYWGMATFIVLSSHMGSC